MNDIRLVNVMPIVNGWNDAAKKNLEEAKALMASGNHLDYNAGVVKESVANLVSGFADDLMKAPAVDIKLLRLMQWVSVNDLQKHPQHEKPYIVSLTSIASGKSENAFAKYDCELDVWQLCDDYGTLFGPDGTAYYSPDMNAELTHWMEQPQPPKEERNV